jgi:hypothetical protein
MASSKIDQINWQAQDDARTMARYEEIMADTARKNRAIREAKKQAKDLSQRANVMNKIAGKKK